MITIETQIHEVSEKEVRKRPQGLWPATEDRYYVLGIGSGGDHKLESVWRSFKEFGSTGCAGMFL